MPEPASPPAIGVDLSATNLQFGVVASTGEIIGRTRGKTEAPLGLDRVIDNVVKGIGEACEAAGVTLDEIGAVGIVSAGAIDMPRGVILNAPNLGWTDVPLRDMLQDKLGRAIVLDNDVNGAVWGEYRLGAGRGRGDLLGVWVGTGIGGGLVLNGHVYHGSMFTAGEIGHTMITPHGAPGERVLEDHSSRSGMSKTLLRLLPQHPDSVLREPAKDSGEHIGTQALAEAYGEGDPLTVKVVNDAADLLGVAVANWVTVLSLDTVIFGGGITEALGAAYVDRIRQSFRANVFPQECQACELRITELAADSGLLGAALLAREAI